MAITPIDPDLYATLAKQAQATAAATDRPNAVIAGLKSGTEAAAGIGASGVGLIGKLIGSQAIEDLGRGGAAVSAQKAAEYSRPDLENLTDQSLGSALPYLGYQLAKAIPSIAPVAVGASLLPEIGVGGAIGGALGRLPAFMGGGSAEAGAALGSRVAGLTVAGTPMQAAGFYQNADQKPGGATYGDALQSLAMAPVGAALYGAEISPLGVAAGGIKNALARGLTSAATAMVQGGATQAMSDTMRPDLTTRAKLSNVVDASLNNAAIGAAFGIGGGLFGHGTPHPDATSVPNEDIKAHVDQQLQLSGPPGSTGDQLALPAPDLKLNAPATYVDAEGRAAQGSQGLTDLNTPPPQIDYTTLQQEKQGSLRWAQPYEQGSTAPYAGATRAELETSSKVASDYLVKNAGTDEAQTDHYAAIKERLQGVNDELQQRDALGGKAALINERAQGSPAEAVEPGSDVTGGSANSSAPVSAEPHIPDLLKGVSSRKAYKDLTSIDDVVERLRNRRESGNDTAGDDVLAEKLTKLGVDLDGKQGAAADDAQSGAAKPTDDKTSVAGSTTDPSITAALEDKEPTFHDLREQEKGAPLNKTEANAAAIDESNYTALKEVTPDLTRDDFQQRTAAEPAAPDNLKGGGKPDEAFQKDFTARITGDEAGKGAITQLGDLATSPPKNAEEAKQRIFHALGSGLGEGSFSSVERLAKDPNIGLLTKDGTLSDEGMRVAREQLPLESQGEGNNKVVGIKDAAFAHGHTTDDAVSAFEQGARGAKEMTSKSLEAPKAFEDGKAWATDRKTGPIPDTATAAETRAVLERIGAGKEMRPSPELRAQHESEGALSNHIDDLYSSTHTPGELAQLKTLVREGRYNEVADAAKEMRSGKTVLANPVPERPFEPARPGGILSAKAMTAKLSLQALENEKAARAETLGRASTETKAANQKAMADHDRAEVRYRGELSDALKAARDNGDITAPQRAVAFSALARGDYPAVERALSGEPPRTPSSAVRNMLNGVAKIAAGSFGKRVVPAETRSISPSTLAKVRTGDVDGTLRAIQATTKNAGYRLIASKLEGRLGNVKLNLLADNDPRGAGRNAESKLEEHGGSSINIFGQKGLTEEAILHEMLHAYVQQRWGGISDYHGDNRALLNDSRDRSDATIASFQGLWDKISDHLEKNHPDLVKNEMWANQVHEHPDEMLSWVMTNPDAQAALRGMPAVEGEKATMWSKVVDFFKGALGIKGKPAENALDQILSAGHAVLDAGAKVEPGNSFVRDLAKGISDQTAANEAGTFDHTKPYLSSVDKANMSPADGNLAMKAAAEKAESIADLVSKIPFKSMGEALIKNELRWADPFHISQRFGKLFEFADRTTGATKNWLDEHVRATDTRHTIVSQLAQHLVMGDDMVQKLVHGSKEDKVAAGTIVQFMRNSVHGYRVDRSWSDQSKEFLGTATVAVRTAHAADYGRYKEMSDTQKATYAGLRDSNDALGYGHMAGELHKTFVDLVPDADRSPAYSAAPGDNFQEALANPANRLQQDPAALKGFFKGELNDRLNAIDKHAADTRAASQGLEPAEAEKMTKGLVELEDMAKTYRDHMQTIENKPYFHLGRFGNNFVDIKIARDEDGNVKPEMVAKLADHLKSKNFDGLTIMPENSSDHAFIRVDSVEARDALALAAHELMGTGILDETGGKDGTDVPIIAGNREQVAMRNPGAENWARDLMSRVANDKTLSPGEKERVTDSLRSMQLNLLSDKALAQSLAKREGTHGWDSDMMRSWNNRGRIGAAAIAGQTTAPKLAAAMKGIETAVKDHNHLPPTEDNLKERSTMKFVENEFKTREAQARMPSTNPFLDRLSAITQASYLGGSISFVATQLSQPFITTLPHLGARYGFVRSADAMAKNTSLAFNILKETMKLGMKTTLGHGADAQITAEALRNVKGMTDEQREFMLRMINTGQIDISGAARQQMRAAESGQGGKIATGVDKTLRWGASVGYYSETLTRLTAALASHQLDGPKVAMADRVDNARNVLKQTLFDYSPGSKGRMFGKQGVFGVATPLMTKFMTYTANVTGKLYREVHTAIGGDTPQERMEAAKFLMGHMAMLTVLAGTTGLPLTTALSSVYDKTHDALFGGKEPSDIRSSFRDYMQHMFGPTFGHMITDGASRAAGVDLNQRLGEQDILPFSKFLADRRGFKEASKDLAFRTFGAPTALIKSWADGMGKVAQGNVLPGLGEALPHVLAGPIKAYGLYRDGYVDSHGTKLPISASGANVLTQALGFQPSNKVDYDAAAHAVEVRKTLITQQGTVIKNQLANALAYGGDPATARALMAKAQEFDQLHGPDFAIMPQLGGMMQKKVADPAIARAIGAPLGVKPSDIGAIKLSAFANIGKQAQTR